MSIEDEMAAQRALFHYLTEWGVEDAGKRSQKFIDELVGRGWQMDPRYESRPQPPRADVACFRCGRHVDRCICPQVASRPPERVPANSEFTAARQALRTAAREHLHDTTPATAPDTEAASGGGSEEQ